MGLTDKSPFSTLNKIDTTESQYSVEFFHIYTDESIGDIHKSSLQYLNEAKKAWNFKPNLIVLIDDYTPTDQLLTKEVIFQYLKERGELPNFWAFEKDLVPNAQMFLQSITSKKLKKSYEHYIDIHGKYPCSLLTASWYATRLGLLNYTGVIKSLGEKDYVPATNLINILPYSYKELEGRCSNLILHSEFASHMYNIQDLFIPVSSERVVNLW